MSRLLILAALAGGGYWAYQQGHLDQLIARFMPAGGGSFDVTIPSVLETLGGRSPVIEANGTGVTYGDLSREEKLLWDNADYLSPWSSANLTWTAAMMWQESRGRVTAKSNKGALGLMQVMPGTATDLFRWGWDDMQPSQDVLLTARGSIYFGTAYLEYLSRKNPDREWMARAYNAGPGGKRSDGTWPSETVKYLAAVKGRYDIVTKGELT